MSEIAHHLLRRGFDATQEHYSRANDDDNERVKRIAMTAMAIVWITALVYMAFMSAISYTYGEVIATLAMIETPTATAYTVEADEVDAPLLDQKTDKMAPVEADLYLVKQAPITSKLRTAIRHITSVGGRLARFRGFSSAIIFQMAYGFILNTFTTRGAILRPIVAILATVVLCRIQMVWTHVVISNPSEKRWYQRFPTAKQAKNIILPTLVFATAKQAAIYVPMGLFVAVVDTWHNPTAYGSNPDTIRKIAVVEMGLIALIGLAMLLFVVIPADVVLKRVQASMLPEEHETIVPFDRTFAGKVVPEVVGGSGAVGMLDAWKSFDGAARMRLLKIYIKVIAVQIATTIAFFMVVGAELRMVMGKDFEKMVNSVHGEFTGRK